MAKFINNPAGMQIIRRGLECAKQNKYGVHIEIMEITPELAGDFLATNFEYNRSLSAVRVVGYAAAMEEGHWTIDPTCIAFDINGQMVNGQHRLNSVISSGKPVIFAVMFGLTTEAVLNMDTGYGRKPGHALQISGYANGTALASIANAAWRWNQRSNESAAWKTYKLDRIQLNEYVEKNLEILHMGLTHSNKAARTIRMSPTSAALAWILFAQTESTEEADAFFDAVATGAMLTAKSPILQLRERISRAALETNIRKIDAWEQLCLCIKAWNLFQTRKEITNLVWSEREGYPTPLRAKRF